MRLDEVSHIEVALCPLLALLEYELRSRIFATTGPTSDQLDSRVEPELILCRLTVWLGLVDPGFVLFVDQLLISTLFADLVKVVVAASIVIAF